MFVIKQTRKGKERFYAGKGNSPRTGRLAPIWHDNPFEVPAFKTRAEANEFKTAHGIQGRAAEL